ncbi:MAG: sensor histidine kinase [Pseudomonadota bacterium]
MTKIQARTCCLCWALLVATVAAAQPLTLSRDESQALTAHIDYLIETPPFAPHQNGRFAPNIPPGELQNAEFKPYQGRTLNFGYTANRAWLRVVATNPLDEGVSRYLTTGQRYMRPIIVYEMDSSGSYIERLYNDQFQPFSARPVPLPTLVVQLDFEPFETKNLLVYIGAAGSLSLNLMLSPPGEVEATNNRSIGSLLFISGIIFALVIINLAHFVALRRPAYLAYAVMETCIGLYLLHMDGYAFQYLWPDFTTLNAYGTPLLGHAANLAGTVFVILFLDLHRTHMRLAVIPLIYGAISLVLLLTMSITPVRLSNELGTFMTSTGPLVYAAIGAYTFFHGNKSAAFFVMGWLSLGVGNFLFGASVIGWIDLPLISTDWLRLGALGEALLLSIGLSDQVRRLNREFLTSQEQLIDAANARLKEARERLQLEQANFEQNLRLVEMDKKLATTSHDVSQPIYSLRLAMGGLARQLRDPASVETLNRTLDSMEAILKENLDPFREAQAPIVVSDFGDLFDELIQSFSEEARDREVALRAVRSSIPVPSSLVVPLRRVIQNLLVNALRHGQCSRILMGLRRRSQGHEIVVADDGIGMGSVANPGLGHAIIRDIASERGWEFSSQTRASGGMAFRLTMKDAQ